MLKKVTSFDDTHIAYDINKNRTRWFLIFLHGAGGDLRAWDAERAFFHERGISTLAVDLRGHGLSDRPQAHESYALDHFAQDVHAVIHREQIRKYILVGHCFGGMVSMSYQRLFPNKARSYVFIDTTDKAPISLELLDSIPLFKRLINSILDNAELRTRHFSHIDYRPFVGTSDVNLRRLLSDVHHMTFKSWLFVYEAISEFDAIDALATIRRPALVVYGTDDSIFGPDVAKDITRRIKNAKLDYIPNANHIVVLNNSEELANEIWKFLLDVRRTLHIRLNQNRSLRHLLRRIQPPFEQ